MRNLKMTREQIETEIRGLDNLMKQHDYIGTKIAMGRATKEDYADEIVQSAKWADEKNELNQQLAEMDKIVELC